MDTNIARIWRHLTWIAAEPRFAETARLEECRQYCEQELQEGGWNVVRRQFAATGSALQSLTGINLVCSHTVANATLPTFVLGAHLDSREDTPGADDNASAVAVLLEISKLMGQRLQQAEANELKANLELVVFDLEEHGMLGGAFHAAACRQEVKKLHGMVSLEMLGYCSHEPGSQKFPQELADRYPDVGNFIGVVGNQVSGTLIEEFCTAFRSVPELPCEFLQVPVNGNSFPPTRLSDHSPFWDEGFAALMITDTSFMRNPHYHMSTDTPETLDRVFLHKVAEGVLRATEKIVLKEANS